VVSNAKVINIPSDQQKRSYPINYTFNENILCTSILEIFLYVRMFIVE
jgi:hypothetical protein